MNPQIARVLQLLPAVDNRAKKYSSLIHASIQSKKLNLKIFTLAFKWMVE